MGAFDQGMALGAHFAERGADRQNDLHDEQRQMQRDMLTRVRDAAVANGASPALLDRLDQSIKALYPEGHHLSISGLLGHAKPQPQAAPTQDTSTMQTPAMTENAAGPALPASTPVTVKGPDYGKMTAGELLRAAVPTPEQEAERRMKLDYAARMNASDAEHASKIKNVESTKQWMQQQGIPDEQIQKYVESQLGVTQRPVYKEFTGPNGERQWLDATQPVPPGWTAIAPGSAAPKVGSFGDFLAAAYGPHPTARQYAEGRKLWAQSAGSTTTGTHQIAVPQPDGTIKLVTVQTSSTKGGGDVASLPGERADAPQAVPPPAGEPGSASEPKKKAAPRKTVGELLQHKPAKNGSAKSGDVVGGRQTQEEVKARTTADQLETLNNEAQARIKDPTPVNQQSLLITWAKAQVVGAGGRGVPDAEVERGLNAGSYGTRAKNAWDLALTGKLDPQFMQQVAKDIDTAYQAAKKTASQYDKKPDAGQMVNMKAPNGQIKPVPADQVDHYKSLGATVVQ